MGKASSAEYYPQMLFFLLFSMRIKKQEGLKADISQRFPEPIPMVENYVFRKEK